MIADSSVWIHYLRTPDTEVGRELARLLDEDQVATTGVVLAEVLQGTRTERDFARLQSVFELLPYVELSKATWTRAAEIAVEIRKEGRLIPMTDLSIAAAALAADDEVFTLDEHFGRISGLRLHEVP